MFEATQSVEVSFSRGVRNDFFQAEDHPLEPCGDKWRIYTDNPDRVVKYLVSRADWSHSGSRRFFAITGPSLEETLSVLDGA